MELTRMTTSRPRERRAAVLILPLLLLVLVAAASSTAAPDKRPPRIVAATMIDGDRDAKTDALRLTYSKRIRHAGDVQLAWR